MSIKSHPALIFSLSSVFCTLLGSVACSGEQAGPSTTTTQERTADPALDTAVDPETPALTAEQVLAVGQQLLDNYRENAEAHAARLQLEDALDQETHVEVAADRTWTLVIGVKRLIGASADVTTLVLCHEIGHLLGGFPFKGYSSQAEGIANGSFGTVVSAESNADYFATKECMPRIWASQRSVNAKFRPTAGDYAKSACDEIWASVDEQNLCYRSLAATEATGRWLVSDDGEAEPHLDTPDNSTVTAINTGYPRWTQCRVDTMVAGALCRTKFRGTNIPGLIAPFAGVQTNPPWSEADAALDSCTEGRGARPACWFIENTPQPLPCTDAPELGECVVRDGVPIVRRCDATLGLLEQACHAPLQTCEADETGYADCVTVKVDP